MADSPIHLHTAEPARRTVTPSIGIYCNDGVYHAVDPSRAAMWKTVFQQRIMERLADQGLLVPVTLLDNQPAALLRQEILTVESCSHEWCPAMLRDAARVLLNCCLQLARRGYTLNRINGGTVQFHGGRAMVYDITSLAPIGEETTWLGYPEFAARFLYPLAMMVHGQDSQARRHLASGGVGTETLRQHLPYDAIPASLRSHWRSQSRLAHLSRPVRRWWRGEESAGKHSDGRQRDCVVRKLQWAREELEGIAPKIEIITDAQWPADEARVEQVIGSLHPRRILQCGRPTPIRNIDCISCHAAPSEAAQWYGIAQRHAMPLTPLLIDLSQPLPHSGRPAMERLPSDLLIAEASGSLLSPLPSTLSAHLEWLVPWAGQWLLLRFPRQWTNAPAELVTALHKRFDKVINLTGDGTSGPLLLCEK